MRNPEPVSIEYDQELYDQIMTRMREKLGVGKPREGTHVSDLLYCLVPDQRVAALGVTGATMRAYEGEVITIKTAAGDQLTVTPNHPILSTHGWMAAGELYEGCEIAQGAIGQRRVRHADDVEVPTAIADVFSTLLQHGLAAECSGSRDDFHGDGTDGIVNVVLANRHLAHAAVNTKSLKTLDNLILPSVDVCPSVLPRLGPFNPRLLNISAVPSASNQLRIALFSQFGSKVRRLCRPKGSIASGVDVLRSVRTVPHCEPSTAEVVAEKRITDCETLGNVSRRFPGEVTLVQVVKIERKHFSGHVYNLETTSGVYVAEGIITHNCALKSWAKRQLGLLPSSSSLLDDEDDQVLVWIVGRSHEDMFGEGFIRGTPEEKEGIVGTIDFAGERLIEAKSTRASSKKWLDEMPHYIAQAASYCYMHGQTEANVLIFHIMGDYFHQTKEGKAEKAGPKAHLKTYRVHFEQKELEKWWRELKRRKAIYEGEEKPTREDYPELIPMYDWECGFCKVGKLVNCPMWRE